MLYILTNTEGEKFLGHTAALVNPCGDYWDADANDYVLYVVEYPESVVDYIFNIVKDEKEYGARPIMRAIRDTIEDKITDALLAMDYRQVIYLVLQFGTFLL